MSCNGCRVLRKGCSETCVLGRAYAGLNPRKLKAKPPYFWPSFSAVVTSSRLSLPSPNPNAQSLLFEACGRTVNPVNGAVGLLSSGNWHICQAAVETVLQGGALRPIPGILAGVWSPSFNEPSDSFYANSCNFQSHYSQSKPLMRMENQSASTASDLSLSLTTKFGGGRRGTGRRYGEEKKRAKTMSSYSEESKMTTVQSNGNDGSEEREILNLFV